MLTNQQMIDLRRLGKKFPPGTRIKRIRMTPGKGTVTEAAKRQKNGPEHVCYGGAFASVSVVEGRVKGMYVSIDWDDGMKEGSQVEKNLEVIE